MMSNTVPTEGDFGSTLQESFGGQGSFGVLILLHPSAQGCSPALCSLHKPSGLLRDVPEQGTCFWVLLGVKRARVQGPGALKW